MYASRLTWPTNHLTGNHISEPAEPESNDVFSDAGPTDGLGERVKVERVDVELNSGVGIDPLYSAESSTAETLDIDPDTSRGGLSEKSRSDLGEVRPRLHFQLLGERIRGAGVSGGVRGFRSSWREGRWRARLLLHEPQCTGRFVALAIQRLTGSRWSMKFLLAETFRVLAQGRGRE